MTRSTNQVVNEIIENILIFVLGSVLTLIVSIPLRQSYSDRVKRKQFLKSMRTKLQATETYFRSHTGDYSRRHELVERLEEDKLYLKEMYKEANLSNCSSGYREDFNYSIAELENTLERLVKDVVKIGYLINLYNAFIRNIDRELLVFYKKWRKRFENWKRVRSGEYM